MAEPVEQLLTLLLPSGEVLRLERRGSRLRLVGMIERKGTLRRGDVGPWIEQRSYGRALEAMAIGLSRLDMLDHVDAFRSLHEAGTA
jgi:hypothetical protein